MAEVSIGAPAVAGRSAEFWGYLMWGLAGAVIAVPELAAVFDFADWPTISATIGHLESEHSWVRLVVVFVIVVLGYYSLPQLAMPPRVPAALAGRQTTANGRVTPDPDAVRTEGMGGYLVLACAALAAAVAFAAGARAMDPGVFTGAYVLYGTIAVMWVIVPSVLSMFFAREVAFPTLFRTIGYLERRAGFVAAIILGLLAILLIHLALYPWPRMNG
ncbi:hypothetical protein [Nocardia spumae]|uniref:hypothetical protein n=1 Tax=Nocardia spumae TaxID=2887190 RepID=UPI001D1463C4|nr:hypothetical protein [Nocardia spumae]